ncbi:MAG TPA: FAD-dependent oxidoreductase [Candidatus Acidoferrales bacterium]
MARERFLIIGGVAAGMSAASRARKRNSQLEIVVLEKGDYVSYGACGLPYFLSGQVKSAEDLIVYSPQFFRDKRNIDVRLGHEAVEIDAGRRRVILHHSGRTEALPYDKLLISTGGAPAETIPGAGTPPAFTCNDLAGTIRLKRYLDEKRPASAVIAGSGYIGLEVADAFRVRGMDVTILERSHSVLEGLAPEIEKRVEDELAAHGVRLRLNSEVTAIAAADGGAMVQYGTNGALNAGVVLLSTGIKPRTSLAESAGVKLGATGAVAVDERMQTSVAGIYAAGDCVETVHLVTGKPAYFPLGTTANKQGRVAGDNAAGGNARFAGIVGTMVTKVFALELATTGLSVEQSRTAGFRADAVTIESISRAKYFDGKPLLVSLVWDTSSGRLMGCQMAGEEGVAKRIDVAAMALHARMRIEDMLHLDLSYAPPFAPVWDPLLVAVNEAYKKHSGR